MSKNSSALLFSLGSGTALAPIGRAMQKYRASSAAWSSPSVSKSSELALSY